MSDAENLNEAADSGLLQPRLVRPRWVDTCTCIRVVVEVSPCRQNESPDSYRNRWKQTVQSAYERGADWNYDADCQLCWCGDISGTNI